MMKRPVKGFCLGAKTLAEFCPPTEPLLVVFLPQLGSAFARAAVRDIFKAAKRDPRYPRVLFFHHDSLEAGQQFFTNSWQNAKAVADPEMYFYREFGIPAGGLWEMAQPRALASGLKALLKGHLPRKPSSDPWTLPGVFVIIGNRILWSHNARHVGDFPAFGKIRSLVEGLVAQAKSRAREQMPRAG